jgi:hypothetical protein
MVMNLTFLILSIFALWRADIWLRLLSHQILTVGISTGVVLFITGFFGVLAACQKQEGMFKAYSAFAVFNFSGLCAGGFILLFYAGVFSTSGVHLESTLCGTLYPNSTTCSCADTLAALGHSFNESMCPQPTCLSSNITCKQLGDVTEEQEGYYIRDFDVCSLTQVFSDSKTTDLDELTLQNFTNATTTPSTLHVTDTSMWFSGWFTCNQSTTFEIKPESKLQGSVAMFLNTLNIAQQISLVENYTGTKFDTLEESIEEYQHSQLLALAETDCILHAMLLLMCATFQLMLFVTNQLIIKWNHDNNHPHGRNPFWRKIHRALHLAEARAKVYSVLAFNKAANGTLGHSNITVAAHELDRVKTWTVKLKLYPTAFGDGVWGLGITFAEKQLENNDNQGRKIVE